MKYDLIIVGAGCAGCSAAITGRQRNMSALVIYSGDGGLEKAQRVDNYPGLPRTSGAEIIRVLRQQALDMGAELKKQLVQKVMPMGDGFMVLAGNEVYEAKAVLLALGIARVNPLPGEEELLGAGVSYCATCDGMFYRDKQMLVVAGGAEAAEEANYLSELGQVRYFPEKPHNLDGLLSGIEVIREKPVSLHQAGEGIRLETDKGAYQADGVFVLRPAVAMTQLMPEVTAEKGAILVDKNLMTNVPGVFAAGDILGNPLQAAKAVGDGNHAALSAANYLRKQAGAASANA